MAHQLRFIEAGVTYHLVRRTQRGRHAFVPTRALRAELAGVIGDAQRLWPQVKVHGWCWLSNHFHAQITPVGLHAPNATSAWLNFVLGESAKVAQAIHGLKGPIWEKRRCRLVPLETEASQRACAKYIMAQATAAGLVARPRHWPGLNTCDALCRGAQLRGYRGTAELRRRSIRERVPMVTIAPIRTVKLSPLPSHAGWSDYERQQWYREIEAEILEETAAANPGRRYPAPEHYATLSPHREQPLEARPPRPWYARPGEREARARWRARFRAFTAAWREALAEWIRGAPPRFPPGGWVPFKACYAPGYVQRQ